MAPWIFDRGFAIPLLSGRARVPPLAHTPFLWRGCFSRLLPPYEPVFLKNNTLKFCLVAAPLQFRFLLVLLWEHALSPLCRLFSWKTRVFRQWRWVSNCGFLQFSRTKHSPPCNLPGAVWQTLLSPADKPSWEDSSICRPTPFQHLLPFLKHFPGGRLYAKPEHPACEPRRRRGESVLAEGIGDAPASSGRQGTLWAQPFGCAAQAGCRLRAALMAARFTRRAARP